MKDCRSLGSVALSLERLCTAELDQVPFASSGATRVLGSCHLGKMVLSTLLPVAAAFVLPDCGSVFFCLFQSVGAVLSTDSCWLALIAAVDRLASFVLTPPCDRPLGPVGWVLLHANVTIV